jgi:xylulokinase
LAPQNEEGIDLVGRRLLSSGSMSDVVLAADLGASSLRVGAVTHEGRIIAHVASPLGSDEPQPGWSEIDPEIWWRSFAALTGEVLTRLGSRHRVVGICCAGLTRSQVLLDADVKPLRRAILFRDRRAAEEATAFAADLPSDNPAEAITAFHPLARLLWVSRQEPALFARVAATLEPKDFLNLRLSGRIASDAVSASRYDALQSHRVLAGEKLRCLELLHLDRLAPWEEIGTVTTQAEPFAALAGVPVFAGGMDSWAGAIGAGAIAPGQAYDIAGTSEAAGLVTSQRARVRGLVSLCWGDGAWQVGGPTQVGADSAVWCHRIFRLRGSLSSAIQRAGTRRPDPGLPMFLPYLAGERTPVWRDDVRGAFHGVARHHEPDDFLWAVLEGAAHAVRDILATAIGGTGEPVTEVRICGGGARSDAWCQLRADVLGLPVMRTAARETGILGAAISGWIGLKRHASLTAAVQKMTRVEHRFEPQPALAEFYSDRARLYARVKDAALSLADTVSTTPSPVTRPISRQVQAS